MDYGEYLHQNSVQIHTQIYKSRDSGDVGDIFRLYLGRISYEKNKLAFVDGQKRGELLYCCY